MRRRLLVTLSVVLSLMAAIFPLIARGDSGTVYVVPVKGDIDDGTVLFVARALKEAEGAGAKAVVFDIDTYGGLVDASNRIRDEIMASGVRTIAFVDQKAWSAGALVALSCDGLYMGKGGSIGAAETRPAEEKYISAYRQQFESTASENGRDPKVAGSMVDSDIEIAGLKEKGKILTLGAEDAVRIGFADGTYSNVEDMLLGAGLSELTRIDFSMNNMERFGQFLTSPVTSEILLMVGVVGLIVEAFTPGFGIFGMAGVLGFALFFYGRIITGMAGWEIVALFIVGMILLMIELFIPGFGVIGVSGLIAIFASFVMSYPTPGEAFIAVSIALAFAIAAIIILVRVLDKKGVKGNSFIGRLILTEVTGKNIAVKPAASPKRPAAPKTGDEGIVFSTLRPVGTAYFGRTKTDVLSEGEFLPPGTEVVVERIEGSKIIVRKLDRSAATSTEDQDNG